LPSRRETTTKVANGPTAQIATTAEHVAVFEDFRYRSYSLGNLVTRGRFRPSLATCRYRRGRPLNPTSGGHWSGVGWAAWHVEFECDVVDVAPVPVLTGFVGSDELVFGLGEVSGGMAAG
jgi:hypothetical protein